jgi:hypothetical protein
MSGRTIRKQMFEQGHAPAWIPGDCAHCAKALTKNRSFTYEKQRLCQPCRKAIFHDASGNLKDARGPDVELGVVDGWTRWLDCKEVSGWLAEMDLPRNALTTAMRKESGWNVDGMAFERTDSMPYLYRIEVGI